MSSRFWGAALIAGVVIAPFVFGLRQNALPSRETSLAERIRIAPKGRSSALRSVRFSAATMPPSSNVASLIPDPFLRSGRGDALEVDYDAALQTLLAGESHLAERQVDVGAALRLAAVREGAFRASQLQVENARGDPGAFNVAMATLGKTTTALEDARMQVGQARSMFAAARDDSARLQTIVESAREERDRRIAGMPVDPGRRGALVERNTLLIVFDDAASVDGVEALLEKYQLTPRSVIANTVVVETPSDDTVRTFEAEATRLRALIALLEKENGVKAAVQNTLLGPNVIPDCNGKCSRDWFAGDDALVKSRFPEAWNFNDAVRTRGGKADVGVLDVGFLSSHEDVSVTATSPCGSSPDLHGTQVAAIIAARFGDAVGIDGGSPFSDIVGCSPAEKKVDTSKLSYLEAALAETGALFDAFYGSLNILLGSKVRVINASVGYNWASFSLVASKQDEVKTLVGKQGTAVRDLLLLYPDKILVASAGNDCHRLKGCAEPAMWNSPFNWAALGATKSGEQPSTNVIVVEGLAADNVTRLPMSNVGGTIKAIGENVMTATASPSPYGPMTGTSAAAPLVSATIALMLAGNDRLSVGQIRRGLGMVPGAVPVLDTFSAVMSSAKNPHFDLANLRQDLVVDDDDFDAFKDAYVQIAGGFKTDLNGDGAVDTNEAMFARMDLDGNGRVEPDDLKIMARAWTNGPIDPEILKKRLKE